MYTQGSGGVKRSKKLLIKFSLRRQLTTNLSHGPEMFVMYVMKQLLRKSTVPIESCQKVMIMPVFTSTQVNVSWLYHPGLRCLLFHSGYPEHTMSAPHSGIFGIQEESDELHPSSQNKGKFSQHRIQSWNRNST